MSKLRIGDTNNNNKKDEDPKLTMMKSQSNAIGLSFCGKCYDFKPSTEMFNTVGCDHKFCRDCIREHVASNLRNDNIINVSCLDSNCKVKYGPDNFFSILPFQVFQRWKKAVQDCNTPILDNNNKKPLKNHEQVKSSTEKVPIVLVESDDDEDDDLEDFKIKTKGKKNKNKRNKRGRIIY